MTDWIKMDTCQFSLSASGVAGLETRIQRWCSCQRTHGNGGRWQVGGKGSIYKLINPRASAGQRIYRSCREPSWVPSTHIWWLTTACNSCSQGAYGLCGHLNSYASPLHLKIKKPYIDTPLNKSSLSVFLTNGHCSRWPETQIHTLIMSTTVPPPEAICFCKWDLQECLACWLIPACPCLPQFPDLPWWFVPVLIIVSFLPVVSVAMKNLPLGIDMPLPLPLTVNSVAQARDLARRVPTRRQDRVLCFSRDPVPKCSHCQLCHHNVPLSLPTFLWSDPEGCNCSFFFYSVFLNFFIHFIF